MRIPGDFSNIAGIYNKNKAVSKIERIQDVKGKKDAVILSDRARDYQIAFKAVHQIPDIREEKIRQLEEKYSSGTYQISGKEVAEKNIE
ncbi:MAG: flagellar biosynthesis anti-sigma factor FlgM [Clostridiaceae bacterium]|nr:flagellar biosynthesis anti-sigma factor FlgM [Clostridiaceae bacterium]